MSSMTGLLLALLLIFLRPSTATTDQCLSPERHTKTFTTPRPSCHIDKHCSNSWRIVTLLALTEECHIADATKVLDEHSTDCGQQDQAYLMFPEKFRKNNTKIDTFYPHFYSDQMLNFQNGTNVDGELMADMMDAMLTYFSVDQLEEKGGLVNIFVDVNCTNLCTERFFKTQARFIFDMIAWGYSVHIYPMGDPIQNECAKNGFVQCSKYNSTYCNVHSKVDGLVIPYSYCVPFTVSSVVIVGISVSVSIVAAVVLVLLFLRYQFHKHGKYRRFWATIMKFSPILKTDQWELGRDQLEIDVERQLGSGAFATVYAGKLNGKRPVDNIQPAARFGIPRSELIAVKRVPVHADKQERKEFLSEVAFMKKLGYHHHILGMIGCITNADLPLIVLEYCENGDLLTFVRKHKYTFSVRGEGSLRPKDLLSIAWQISDGLCYLKEKALIHRDLAARNILLTRELLVKSDVWSYGVTLWEMYTFGDVPFAAVNPTNMLNLLDNGGRLPQGAIPDVIYSLISKCWASNPNERSKIEELKDQLTHILSAHSQYYGYVCLSESVDSLPVDG